MGALSNLDTLGLWMAAALAFALPLAWPRIGTTTQNEPFGCAGRNLAESALGGLRRVAVGYNRCRI